MMGISFKEFRLFETDGEYFWRHSLLNRMRFYDERREKARRSANIRWKKCKRNAIAMQIKKSKGK